MSRTPNLHVFIEQHAAALLAWRCTCRTNEVYISLLASFALLFGHNNTSVSRLYLTSLASPVCFLLRSLPIAPRPFCGGSFRIFFSFPLFAVGSSPELRCCAHVAVFLVNLIRRECISVLL
jgi:hypothetical protein